MSLVSGETAPPPPPEKPSAPHPRCRNCGHEVHAVYCPRCGQNIADNNQSLWQFIKDFLEEFIQFDSKFLRTVVPLCFKPGFLTSEWTSGRRVRYITPLKLYITLSALFFLVLSYQPHGDLVKLDSNPKKPGIISVTKDGERSDSSDQWVNELVQSTNDSSATGVSDKVAAKVAEKVKEKKAGKSDSSEGDEWFTNMMNSSVGSFAGSGADKATKRQQLIEKCLDRLPTANLLLLPIFALIFKMLYIRRSRFYVEHLVFALHYYAFAFLALSICLLLPYQYVQIPVGVWLFLYLPISMVMNYRQGFFKTLFKVSIFGFLYVCVVSMTALGLVIITAIQVAHPTIPKPRAKPTIQSPAKVSTAPPASTT